MTEVDQDFLKEGKYYLFFKKYIEYNPDVIICQLVGYDTPKGSSKCAVIQNLSSYIMDESYSVRVIDDDDNTDGLLEMTVEDHSDCWVFELDEEETLRYLMERI